MYDLFAVAEQFSRNDTVVDVREFGNGNINATFLVTLDSIGDKHFVLQRINTQVFRQPELIMRNMRVFADHVSKRLERTAFMEGRRWEVPAVLAAKDGGDYWRDSHGSFWRAISFIKGAKSCDIIKDIGHANEVGYALGMFHSLLSDLPPDGIADTLEGFHVTPLYLRHYHEVLEKFGAARSPEVDYCLKFVDERKAWAHLLEDARAQGRLSLRPIHGDPKVNNILIDTDTGQAISMVDLDTVKPGLIHYDIGDCLRSCCNPVGEEAEKWEKVRFDPDLARAVLRGYFTMARDFLTANDLHYLFDSIRLIAFELGLRFFTDYLEGDVYFRVKRPGHNLARALVQFRLTESIESQEKDIRTIIRELI